MHESRLLAVQEAAGQAARQRSRTREDAAITLWGCSADLDAHERPAVEQALRTTARSDEDGQVRATAIAALLVLAQDSPRVVDMALEVVRGPHWTARTLVAVQLGRVDDPRVVDALIQLLDDEKGPVREAAASSLGRRGDPRALDPLRELLERDRDDVVVRKAAKAAVAMLERAPRER